MPEKRESFNANPEVRRKNAEVQKRDEFGHFIKTKVEVKTPLDAFDPNKSAQNSASSPSNYSSEDNIVDVKVRNPLSKITKILEDIKKHQTTNFAIKFSVPLIALPVFLFIVFQLGRAQTTCATQYVSRIGTFEVLQVSVPEKKNWFMNLFSFFPHIPNITPESRLVPEVKAVLIGTGNEVLNVLYQPQIPVINYKGRTVILTGNYSQCTNTITLDAPENIQGSGL